MTLYELIKKAEHVIEEVYDREVWEGFVETILYDLTPVAKVLTIIEQPITLVNNGAVVALADLEEDIYEVSAVYYQPTGKRKVDLRRIPSHDTVSMGWVKEFGQIRLQNIEYGNGNIILHAYAILRVLEDETVPNDKIFNLQEKYHETLLKGIMSMAMQKEEELDRKNDFLGEYYMLKRQMQAERIRDMEPWMMGAPQGGGQ